MEMAIATNLVIQKEISINNNSLTFLWISKY